MDRSSLLRPGPIIAVVVAVAVWFVAPEIYTGTFSDTTTFFLVAVLAVAVAGWILLVRRLVARRELRLGLIGVPLAVLAYVVL